MTRTKGPITYSTRLIGEQSISLARYSFRLIDVKELKGLP